MDGTSTVYSHELRVLACDACGAPLSAAIAGGLATCAYCGATSQLRARDEAEDRRRAREGRAASISESERMARLRDQASGDEALPTWIAGLLVNGRIPRDAALRALDAWRETRAALRERGDFLTAERLFHLTRLLLPHTKHAARRALLETAVELLPDPRHRHVLRCELAIGAARLGEIAAAQAWLEAVDPRPLDLLMDSVLRTARATIAIARRRGEDVLAELGEHAGDIPAAGWYAEMHELLRAHGLEMVGRYDEALAQMNGIRRDRGESGLEAARAEHAPLSILPRSKLAQRREELRILRAHLRFRAGIAARTPTHAVKVALGGALVSCGLAWLAVAAVRTGWFRPDTLVSPWVRLPPHALAQAERSDALLCLWIVSMLISIAIVLSQVPRTVRARLRERDLEDRHPRLDAEINELGLLIASMSKASPAGRRR